MQLSNYSQELDNFLPYWEGKALIVSIQNLPRPFDCALMNQKNSYYVNNAL